jgi:hypothetical protein
MTMGQKSREKTKEERRDCDETKALYNVFYRFFKNKSENGSHGQEDTRPLVLQKSFKQNLNPF